MQHSANAFIIKHASDAVFCWPLLAL